jgi:hypothetical protein
MVGLLGGCAFIVKVYLFKMIPDIKGVIKTFRTLINKQHKIIQQFPTGFPTQNFNFRPHNKFKSQELFPHFNEHLFAAIFMSISINEKYEA